MTGAGNNTWLLDGAEPALIDAGVGAPGHVDDIARALGGRALARLFVTHGHLDHASGAPALVERWRALACHKWPGASDAPGAWQPLADGERLQAGDRRLEVMHTPGHAPDHVVFWDQDAGDLYAGDMVQFGTTVAIQPHLGGNLRQYLHSLERLAALGIRRILPGHGPIIERPGDLIAGYLEHRRLRDRQVRECLAQGLTDQDAMVARIYPGLAPALRPAARATVDAHLEMIREDG